MYCVMLCTSSNTWEFPKTRGTLVWVLIIVRILQFRVLDYALATRTSRYIRVPHFWKLPPTQWKSGLLHGATSRVEGPKLELEASEAKLK